MSDDRFSPTLEGARREVAFELSTVRYAIDADDRLTAVDEEWDRFAMENAAPGLVGSAVLGRLVTDFVSDRSVRGLYRDLYQRVRAGRRLVVPLRCDSPTLRRFMTLELAPEAAGAIGFACHLQRTETRPYVALLDLAATHGTRLLTICSWCKRVAVGVHWLEVEDAIAELDLFGDPPPGLTHGMCVTCRADFVQRW